jgi:hypothetical protein
MVSLYFPFKTPPPAPDGVSFYKKGRFSFPLFRFLGAPGSRPDLDWLAWERDEMYRGNSEVYSFDWLMDEKFIEAIAPDFFGNNILHASLIPDKGRYSEKVGVRFGYGPMYLCEVVHLKSIIRQYANGGVFSKIYQLTDMAEALLDPGILEAKGLIRSKTLECGSFEDLGRELLRGQEIDSFNNMGALYDHPGFIAGKNVPPEAEAVKHYWYAENISV